MVIYQVFTRLFGADAENPVPNGTKKQNGCGTMSAFTMKALEEIRTLGATHIWYTGIIEHATCTDYSKYGIAKDNPLIVKGRAGSPYAIKDYYDVDPDLAVKVPERIREYELLIERTHKAGMKVIQDFVPNHVARQYHSDACPKGCVDLGEGDDISLNYSPENNFYYLGEPLHLDNIVSVADGQYQENPAKATGNDVFSAWPGRNDWYETVKLNYGSSTYRKMRDILLYWAAKGVDGFRCDMAEMVPVEFWEWVIPQIKEQYPGIIFIAEVYNPALYRDYIYRGGFDYLYDKVGLYDKLKAVTAGWCSAQEITGCWQSVQDIQDKMLNFLENHDEQRIASEFFAGDAKKGRPMLLVSALMNTNPMMVYFGQELGERGMDEEGFSGRDGRTTIFDYWTVDTIRRWRNKGKFDGKLLTGSEKALQKYYRKILNLSADEDAFSKGQFWDLMYVNPQLQRQYAFMRSYEGKTWLVVANFSDGTSEIEVNIPDDACRTFGIKSNTVRVNVKAWDGVVKRIRS